MGGSEDTELVVQARAGDRQAFDRLIRRHRPAAERIAFRMVPNVEIARELAQEAMLEAYLSLRGLRHPERFGSWVYGIVLNLCRKYLGEQKTRAALPMREQARFTSALGVPFDDADPEQLAEARDLHRRVLRAVEALSPAERAAALLFYYEQLSVQEISAILGISVAAVKSRLHQSRKRLRERLSSLYPELAGREPPQPRRSKKMVRMTIADVVVRKTPGEDPEQTFSDTIVVLSDEQKQRALPIWIGEAEGLGIAMGLRQVSTARPMTYSLMSSILDAAGIRVEDVRISALEENVFYAVVRLRQGEKVIEVDARPSDALALAARTGSPIYAAAAVLEHASAGPPHTGSPNENAESRFESVSFGAPGAAGAARKELSPEEIERTYQELMAFVFARPEE